MAEFPTSCVQAKLSKSSQCDLRARSVQPAPWVLQEHSPQIWPSRKTKTDEERYVWCIVWAHAWDTRLQAEVHLLLIWNKDLNRNISPLRKASEWLFLSLFLGLLFRAVLLQQVLESLPYNQCLSALLKVKQLCLRKRQTINLQASNPTTNTFFIPHVQDSTVHGKVLV